MVLEILKIALRLRDRHGFKWQSLEILNVFNNGTLKQILWKTKFFSKKLEYHFLVKNTKIENATFPYKNALSEANVKIEWWIQNEPITKNGVLPVTNLFFWKFSFILRTSYKELIWCTNYPNAYINIFCKGWSFTWGTLFPWEYPLPTSTSLDLLKSRLFNIEYS